MLFRSSPPRSALRCRAHPPATLVGEQCPHEEAEHGRAQANVPGQVPANSLREQQRPLTEGYLRQDSFHQMDGGGVRPHASCTSLARLSFHSVKGQK